MKTFAELKAEQVALGCRGEIKAAAFADLKSSNNLLATYRQIAVQGDEPVFIKCAGTSEGVAKSWEARRANVTDPEHLLSKITEHDTAMHASRTPDEFAAHKLSREAYSATDSGSNFQHKKAHLAAKAAHEKLQLFHAGKGEYGSDEPSKEAVSHREKAMAHREQALEHHAYAKADRDQQLFEEKPEEYERRFPQASEHSTDNPFWMK